MVSISVTGYNQNQMGQLRLALLDAAYAEDKRIKSLQGEKNIALLIKSIR